MARLKLTVATDRETCLAVNLTIQGLEDTQQFEVTRCRIAVVDVGAEIETHRPDLVFAQAAIRHEEDLNELVGFIRRIARLPQRTTILAQTPRLREDQLERLFAAGAELWVDETLAPRFTALALAAAATDSHYYDPLVRRGSLEVLQARFGRRKVAKRQTSC